MTSLEDVAEVAIGSEASALVVIGSPQALSDTYGRFPIRISAPGLSASGWIEYESWSGGAARLPAYFAELADAWRGWSGSRAWHDDGGMIKLSATHNGVGRVDLHVAITSQLYADSPWTVGVDVPIEPGALTSIAERIARLIPG